MWAADSFAGLPPPNAGQYPLDEGINLHRFPQLAVPLERMQDNFRRYGLLDGQVRFLKGWFRDTLPAAPIERLAVLRLDGDLYESTIQALESLYDKLSPGGFVIVDDFGNIEACRQAVHDFRAARGITDAIHPIDWGGVYWRRSPRDRFPREEWGRAISLRTYLHQIVKGGSGGVTAAPPARRMRGQGGG